ncbi:histidine phosphatase family protein [Streptomyces sp. NPDC058372]|uniref:histidine phosphatase family protein n=1 Tax=Streptomyces sp. NPDC058372 TaxID=3346464 RepID=UPI003662B15D
MHVRVTLVTAPLGASRLAERFADDRPLDQAAWHAVQLASHALVPLCAADLRYCSPTHRSRATGDALGFAPLVQPALSDWDMGSWRGLTLGEVAAHDPRAVDSWLRDPRAAPHGGESLLGFVTRVGCWLDTRPFEDGNALVAVAEPAVVRALLVYALKAPPATYWNVDLGPLSTATLTGHPGRWSLRLEAPR